jgi:hypothetical protein
VCVRRKIKHTCVAHDLTRRTDSEVIYTHAYVHANIPIFIPVRNAIVHTIHKGAPLLRTHASRLHTALT